MAWEFKRQEDEERDEREENEEREKGGGDKKRAREAR